MAIVTLQANIPQNIVQIKGYGLLYIKQYGAGNLRIAPDRESLVNTVAPLPVQDGIVQVTADGWKQYFWSGDVWLISDVTGIAVYLAPGNTFFIDRGFRLDPNLPQSDIVADALIDSTYK